MTTRTPIDEFKRSLASATKAISGEPEMEVSFGGDVATFRVKSMRLSLSNTTPLTYASLTHI